jgi:hypothetical protein
MSRIVSVSLVCWFALHATFAHAGRNVEGQALTRANRFISGVHGGKWSGRIVEAVEGRSTRVVLQRKSGLARLFGATARADVTVAPSGEVTANEVTPGLLVRAAIGLGKSKQVGAILRNKKIQSLLTAGAAGVAAQHMGISYDHALALAMPIGAVLLSR